MKISIYDIDIIPERSTKEAFVKAIIYDGRKYVHINFTQTLDAELKPEAACGLLKKEITELKNKSFNELLQKMYQLKKT